ncbi:SGNH/GDSL hydrolase family protein [Pseudomonas sp. GB2N2]
MIAKLFLTLLFVSNFVFAASGPDGAFIDEDFHSCINIKCSDYVVRKFHIDQRALTGPIVYGESFYVEEGRSDEHKTIFAPSRILLVYNPTSGEILRPLIDYIQNDEGIKILPGSLIKKAPVGFSGNISDDDKNKYGVKITLEFQKYQYAVTYEKKDVFNPISYGSLGHLSELIGKNPLKVTFFGDSITQGGNASSVYSEPNQPGYAELVMAYMDTKYPTLWEYRNNSVGGIYSRDAVSAVSFRVLDKKSDLIVLGFGMNDSGTTKPEKYKKNLQRVISAIRSDQPDVPILLVSSTVANRESPIQKTELLSFYLDVLRQISEENESIMVVDVTSTWRMMLKNKKDYDLTGNGFNHPNDFGHRILAESVLTAILGDNY